MWAALEKLDRDLGLLHITARVAACLWGEEKTVFMKHENRKSGARETRQVPRAAQENGAGSGVLVEWGGEKQGFRI